MQNTGYRITGSITYSVHGTGYRVYGTGVAPDFEYSVQNTGYRIHKTGYTKQDTLNRIH